LDNKKNGGISKERSGATREKYRTDFIRPKEADHQGDVDEFGRMRRPVVPSEKDKTNSQPLDKEKSKQPSTIGSTAPPARASVIPAASIPAPVRLQTTSSSVETDEPILSKDELNKLNAKILKAKLLGKKEDVELIERYQREKARYEAAVARGDAGEKKNQVCDFTQICLVML
jgi:hypothetical protein